MIKDFYSLFKRSTACNSETTFSQGFYKDNLNKLFTVGYEDIEAVLDVNEQVIGKVVKKERMSWSGVDKRFLTKNGFNTFKFKKPKSILD